METYKFWIYHWEENTPDKAFLRQPFGDNWEIYTWAEAGQMARKLATGLKSLGLPEKSHTSTLSDVNLKLPSYQKVSTLIVVKDEWSIDDGCLTPRLKVKRNTINQRYQNVLHSWHEDSGSVVWES